MRPKMCWIKWILRAVSQPPFSVLHKPCSVNASGITRLHGWAECMNARCRLVQFKTGHRLYYTWYFTCLSQMLLVTWLFLSANVQSSALCGGAFFTVTPKHAGRCSYSCRWCDRLFDSCKQVWMDFSSVWIGNCRKDHITAAGKGLCSLMWDFMGENVASGEAETSQCRQSRYMWEALGQECGPVGFSFSWHESFKLQHLIHNEPVLYLHHKQRSNVKNKF